MMKLIIALAVVALTASPALAKKYHKRVATDPAWQADQSGDFGYQAYALVPSRGYLPGQVNSTAVYAFGEHQGADPDAFIRLQLLRDPPRIQQ
jgi:hypothetical protein